MSNIRGVYRNGKIEISTPVDWPEGCEVRVDAKPVATPPVKVGIDESEWRDDPESLADWKAWLQTIEPFELSPEEEQANAQFNEIMRQFNLDAIRRQMAQEPLP
jgi:hypothetical protein